MKAFFLLVLLLPVFFFFGGGAGCGMGNQNMLKWAVGIDHLAHFKWVIQKGHPGVDWNLGWGTNRIYTTWYPKQPALNGFMVKQPFFM